jgi:hypothetical protein
MGEAGCSRLFADSLSHRRLRAPAPQLSLRKGRAEQREHARGRALAPARGREAIVRLLRLEQLAPRAPRHATG